MTTVWGTVAVLRLYWREERAQRHMGLLNAIAMPAALAYLGVMVFPEQPELLRSWLAGCVAFGLGMGGLVQVGAAMLSDRFLGRLALLRTAPVSKASYYGAHLAMASLQAIVLLVAAMVAVQRLGLTAVGAREVAAGAIVALCAASAIGGLAAVLALSVADFDQGNVVITIAAVGLALASPVFYQLSDLPLLLQPVALLSPFTHVAPLVRALVDGRPLPPGALAGTVALAVAVNAVSYRLVPWRA